MSSAHLQHHQVIILVQTSKATNVLHSATSTVCSGLFKRIPWKETHVLLLNIMTSSNGNSFPRYWSFVRGIHRSPSDSPHKGQWRGALMFSLLCTWINVWANNRDAGDSTRHRAHYIVISQNSVLMGSAVIKSSLDRFHLKADIQFGLQIALVMQTPDLNILTLQPAIFHTWHSHWPCHPHEPSRLLSGCDIFDITGVIYCMFWL